MRVLTFVLLGLLTITAGLAITLITDDNGPAALESLLNSNETTAALLATVEKQITAPGPLRGSMDAAGGELTINGILAATNQHRAENNLGPLTLNGQLNQAAAVKLNDMFARQYFEHVAPDGVGPGELVDNTQYNYLRVGENLALGNYSGDTEVVQAWMDSPGHRANILSGGYTELGVAVGSGIFEGQQTWLAVQTFALPASVCTAPDPALESSYQQIRSELDALQAQLDAEQPYLDSQSAQASALFEEAAQLSRDGNAKIAAGNQLIEQGNQAAQDGNNEKAEQLWEQGEAAQQAGEELHDQAQSKQAAAKQIQDKVLQTQDSYNLLVGEFNNRNADLREIAGSLNAQINAYNACADQYSED